MNRKLFKEKVIEVVDIDIPNLWGYFKDGVLGACGEVCCKKKGRGSKVYTWGWNVEVKEAL